YLDSRSRGALVGLSIDTSKEDISRAVLDSTNYEAKLNIEKMNEAGCRIAQLRAVGGGARSRRWLQMKADCFGLPVSSMKVREAAALGAAMLAGIALGRFRDADEAVEAMVALGETHEPDPKRATEYEEIFQQ
ncbi:MAG: FGGY-family carbohydrate kinase, partial [Candidatus Sumerlaeota bacterium]|nr:FGGY-family carbohydrate kinase [Candidatus Sumerlaeota bacterium]